MKKMKSLAKRGMILIASWLLISSMVMGATPLELTKTLTDTSAYLIKTTPEPKVSSVGGEWLVLGLARAEVNVPKDYYENYYKQVEKLVKDKKGVLHQRKYTEYSRVVLALTAIGKDPRNVAGYNLITPLTDYDKTVWQGINGPIFALLALDSGNYEVPEGLRDKYIDTILKHQLADGGFALSGKKADADITGMALQSLAKYQNQPKVKVAIGKALTCLSQLQNKEGGYSSWGIENAESTAQVLMALCELGVSVEDSHFVKEGHTLVDNLLTFYQEPGGFYHTMEEKEVSVMATEQSFYALTNLQRISQGKSSLYRMVVVPSLMETCKEKEK